MRAAGPNERLRQAMDAAGYSIERLAEDAGYHPKQVGRWVAEGMVPRRAGTKARVAQLLNVDEREVWPTVAYASSTSEAQGELVALWAHRAEVTSDRWWDLIAPATERIDLLGCAMLFLPEQHPHLNAHVVQRCEAGLRVRLMLLDPDGQEACQRDRLEGLGGTLPARIRTTLHHFAPMIAHPGVELRLIDTPLYNAMYRFDDQMLVTPYLVGKHGYQHPLLHLRNLGVNGVFAGYVGQFEAMWEAAQPAPIVEVG